jgi:protein involved in polysaccharide export with SLBB domain
MHPIPVAVSVTFLVFATTAADAQSVPDVRLRPGDEIRLAIRDEPGLAGDYPVVESGVVLLPEIGFVAVAERDFPEVGREIQDRYARILVDPEILVVPLLRVAVLGEVREPGLYPVDPTQNVGDVLALAGGTTSNADPERISLVRGDGEVRFRITPGDPGMTERFRSGDQIVVGRRGWARENLPTIVGAGASVLVAAMTALLVR